jgi:prophage antirepressor-like protein
MSTNLTFETVEFKVIDHRGQTWLTMRDITAALYSGTEGGDTSVTPLAERAMRRVFARHAHEFTADMTALVKLQTAKGLQKVRIFSLRGAYLLVGMLARTTKAEAFRRWVLDVLEGVTRAPANLHAQLIEAEQEEAQSFARAQACSKGMNQRRKEKPRLLQRIDSLRELVQLALPLEGGAA